VEQADDFEWPIDESLDEPEDFEDAHFIDDLLF